MDPLIIGHVAVEQYPGELRYTTGLAIDADGAPDCYSPQPGMGRDALGNAGRPGNWWGVVTDTGRPDGTPVVQGATDPCPGYYVSTTALVDPTKPRTSPWRYVDAGRVPYLSVPPEVIHAGAHVGDMALVTYRDRWSHAIIADVGPRGKIGEGSPALANALGIDPSPRHGGCGAGVTVRIFLGSRRSPAWPRSDADMLAQVRQLAGMQEPVV